jgi:hypothetical protein
MFSHTCGFGAVSSTSCARAKERNIYNEPCWTGWGVKRYGQDDFVPAKDPDGHVSPPPCYVNPRGFTCIDVFADRDIGDPIVWGCEKSSKPSKGDVPPWMDEWCDIKHPIGDAGRDWMYNLASDKTGA